MPTRRDPKDIARMIGKFGKLRKQSASEWTGTIPLPESVRSFYETVGPDGVTIPACGNPVYLPSLKKMWPLQAGYRWNGLTGERSSEWLESWLLVAECNGDPFILEFESGKILIARHGEGAWRPEPVFGDILEMAGAVAILGGVFEEAGDDFFDDDFFVRPRCRDLASYRLGEFLVSAKTANWFLDFLMG